ncbi:hypothetical protein ACTPOK_30250 [Streptomyces inhibens]|uniref:hypothetical protein n=1 Tax=Streptomyces inhibens TaxID=2293571 RepID=UPI00402AFDAB
MVLMDNEGRPFPGPQDGDAHLNPDGTVDLHETALSRIDQVCEALAKKANEQ